MLELVKLFPSANWRSDLHKIFYKFPCDAVSEWKASAQQATSVCNCHSASTPWMATNLVPLVHLLSSARIFRWAARNVRTGTSDWSQHRKLLLTISCVATSSMVGFHRQRRSTKVVSTSDGGKGLTLTNRSVRAAWENLWPLDAQWAFLTTALLGAVEILITGIMRNALR